ncbi:hypothetical protein F4779DRAFT_615980 [Xylariaceae sp. FL0662B]|nr:hypothetical protein F4779DRAFT_615980 [Xylariaceae sp. FL0662B]
MKVTNLIMVGIATATATVIPLKARVAADSDEAVVYPASVDQSWVDADGINQGTV